MQTTDAGMHRKNGIHRVQKTKRNEMTRSHCHIFIDLKTEFIIHISLHLFLMLFYIFLYFILFPTDAYSFPFTHHYASFIYLFRMQKTTMVLVARTCITIWFSAFARITSVDFRFRWANSQLARTHTNQIHLK